MTPEQLRILELEAALNNAIAAMKEELHRIRRNKRFNHHSSRYERFNRTVIACDKILRGDT